MAVRAALVATLALLPVAAGYTAGGPRGALRMDCEFLLPCAQQRGAWWV